MHIAMSDVIASSNVRFGTSGARGLVESMSDKVCFAYVSAFLQAVTHHNNHIVVLGHDLRPSSPRIAAACASAIAHHGKKVLYVGALPTPALAYYAQQINAVAIVVTGSHIPFDRNGIKFYRADGEISKSDELAIQNATIDLPESLICEKLPAVNAEAKNLYIKRYVDFFGDQGLANLKIAVYEHSSVARDVLRELLEKLGSTVISLGRTDTFVPIDTEAVSAEDAAQAKKWAKKYQFDAILSTDGDADRPLIGDEQGQWLRGDIVGILCAKYLNIDAIATPVSCNTALEKCGWFSQISRTQIGSPYVISAMEKLTTKTNAVAGYEANGGFLLGSNITQNNHNLSALPTRDAILPMLALLSLSRKLNCKLSQITAHLPQRYTASDRLQNIATEKSKSLLTFLQQNLVQALHLLNSQASAIQNIDTTDGLRVTFNDENIVHLRPSGNAPELRCYTESATDDNAKTLCRNCLEKLKKILV